MGGAIVTEPELDVGILGTVRLLRDGVEAAVGTPKMRALLAMLVINRNRAVAIDSLVDAVWNESAPPGARAGIHSYVSNLRKLTGRAALVSAPPGYRLTLPDGACDISRFSAEKAAGTRAAAQGDFEAAGRHLSSALAQWRGQVLEDLRGFAFADTFATALAEERLSAATSWAEAEIACGRAGSVISELEVLAAANPYREPLWAQLISAYYLTERQSEALESHRRLKTTLADELGIDPGPTIQALYDTILQQEPLDVRRSARSSAVGAETVLDQRTQIEAGAAAAWLVESSGRRHPVRGVVTRIGRLPDNDVVVDDAKVSRHHAAVIDTGSSYAISDLRSANGVQVGGTRIHGSAGLAGGDEIRIGGMVFTFDHAAP